MRFSKRTPSAFSSAWTWSLMVAFDRFRHRPAAEKPPLSVTLTKAVMLAKRSTTPLIVCYQRTACSSNKQLSPHGRYPSCPSRPIPPLYVDQEQVLADTMQLLTGDRQIAALRDQRSRSPPVPRASVQRNLSPAPSLRGCRRGSPTRRRQASRRYGVLLRVTRSCRTSSSLRDERQRCPVHRPGGFQSPLSLSITI